MSKYLVQVGYTAEAWTAMGRGPQNVMERVQASAEALGGSIDSLFFCFGDYDLVGIVAFPDSRGVAAWSMAVSSGGGVRSFKTTTLLSVEEGLQALGRATQVTRAAIGRRPLHSCATHRGSSCALVQFRSALAGKARRRSQRGSPASKAALRCWSAP